MTKYQAALKEEVKNRARIYFKIYNQLSTELGQERAIAILKKAIYRRGEEKGKLLAEKIGAPDLRKLAEAFVSGKEEMDVFGHQAVEADDQRAILRLNHCPLVEAWDDMGLAPQEKKIMCDIAYQVDFGKFETAGYKLKFDCRIAEGDASCDMELKSAKRFHNPPV